MFTREHNTLYSQFELYDPTNISHIFLRRYQKAFTPKITLNLNIIEFIYDELDSYITLSIPVFDTPQNLLANLSNPNKSYNLWTNLIRVQELAWPLTLYRTTRGVNSHIRFVFSKKAKQAFDVILKELKDAYIATYKDAKTTTFKCYTINEMSEI